MSVLGSRQGRSRLSNAANSNRNTHLSNEILLIFHYFSEGYMTAFLSMVAIFSLQLSDPAFFPPLLSPFFFFFPFQCETLLGREQHRECLSSLSIAAHTFLTCSCSRLLPPGPNHIPHPHGVVHVLAGLARESGGAIIFLTAVVIWSTVFVICL